MEGQMGDMTPQWKTAYGLSGRFVATEMLVATTGQFEISLELRNDRDKPIAVQMANPFVLQVKIFDAAGKVVEPRVHRSEVAASRQWQNILPSEAVRQIVSTPITRKANNVTHRIVAYLDLKTEQWQLYPGSYQLRGRYLSPGYLGTAPAEAWHGLLDLPPIELCVEKKRRQ